MLRRARRPRVAALLKALPQGGVAPADDDKVQGGMRAQSMLGDILHAHRRKSTKEDHADHMPPLKPFEWQTRERRCGFRGNCLLLFSLDFPLLEHRR